ncbi:MAG: phospholipid carrier-dependent glycosyltransferase [Chloroflexi bacterium]|nr:phospholipid carrier-dependent glycosyltransferase [Chloroflexota bacterium]
MTAYGRRWLWGVTGLAAFFRWRALFANSFHADEALFASFARLIAVWRDPLLQLQPVDKPPLLFYLQALFYPLFGPVEWAARLPNFIASLLLVPLVGVWAWRLFGDEKTAVLAALFVALLPLPIQFSATAFTDPLLTTLLVASLLGGSCGNSNFRNIRLWGIFFGLAVATKHQAWLFLPLAAGLGWLNGWRGAAWRRWLTGFLPAMGGLLLWEWARAGEFQLWSSQVANFGGLRPIWSWELWSRAVDWADTWNQAMGSVWIGGMMAALALWAAFSAWRRRDQQAQTMQLLLLFALGYALLHWLLAIPVWDRYLLPLFPIVALIVARHILFRIPSDRVSASYFLIFFLLLPGAWGARNGRFPIGGYPGADQGAAIVAEALADAPYGAVLYDHWHSWQWRYHLFDKRVYVSWFPSPDALAEELVVFGDDGNPHYLALPDTIAADPVKRAVAQAGFRLQPIPLAVPAQIHLYEIVTIND